MKKHIDNLNSLNKMSKMLLCVTLIVAVCQVADANEWRLEQVFANRSQGHEFNGNQRFGDVPVVRIVETFFEDLQYVSAVEDEPRARDYEFIGEDFEKLLHEGFINDTGRINPAHMKALPKIAELASLLNDNHFREALEYSKQIDLLEFQFEIPGSYLNYLMADLHRLTKNPFRARLALYPIFDIRKLRHGIAANRIEMFDGLLTLRLVYDLLDYFLPVGYESQSLDSDTLRKVHSMTIDKMEPLVELAAEIRDSIPDLEPLNFDEHASVSSSIDRMEGGISDNNLAKSKAEGILYHFFRIIMIAGRDELPRYTRSSDFSRVMEQLRHLDEDIAREFEDRFLKDIDSDRHKAQMEVFEMQLELRDRSRKSHDSEKRAEGEPSGEPEREHREKLIRRIFLAYFNLELNMFQEDCKDLYKVAYFPILLNWAQRAREEHEGISADIWFELVAKFALHAMNCFHERVQLVYGLDDDDDDESRKRKYEKKWDNIEYIRTDMYY